MNPYEISRPSATARGGLDSFFYPLRGFTVSRRLLERPGLSAERHIELLLARGTLRAVYWCDPTEGEPMYCFGDHFAETFDGMDVEAIADVLWEAFWPAELRGRIAEGGAA